MLVAGEASGKTEGSRQVAGQRGGVEGEPVGIAFHAAPRVEMQAPYHLPAAVGDVRVAAQAVGVHVVHAVHTVAAHADGGEGGYLRVSHVSARIIPAQGFCRVNTICAGWCYHIFGRKSTIIVFLRCGITAGFFVI